MPSDLYPGTLQIGYVIQGKNGLYLDKHHRWTARTAREAYIVEVDDIPKITREAFYWEEKPYTLIPVSYGEGRGFRVIGDSQPYPVWFWGLERFLLWYKESPVDVWFTASLTLGIVGLASLFLRRSDITFTLLVLAAACNLLMYLYMFKSIRALRGK